MMEKI